jgi:hypothetical protein
MGYVQQWYEQLSKQVQGLFWKDGGPIIAVQVDNETSDWRYLLALQAVARSVGMHPPAFAKTGWPAPAAGYPADYPMLPYFGGYPDLFWSNDMHDDVSTGSYFYGHGPSDAGDDNDGGGGGGGGGGGSRGALDSLAEPVEPVVVTTMNVQSDGQQRQPQLGWTVPAGYPWLDVEIGGGMATAYNHRVHMDDADMPAMHMVFAATGVNSMGYVTVSCLPSSTIALALVLALNLVPPLTIVPLPSPPHPRPLALVLLPSPP